MILTVRGGGQAAKEAAVAQWYGEQIKAHATADFKVGACPGVSVKRVFVQQMKPSGKLQPHARTIRLNTELAKKPKECIEYIVVHEMIHR